MKKKIMTITALLLCISMNACGVKNEPAAVIPAETSVMETTEIVTETETVAAADLRIRDIAGVWFEDGEQTLDPRTLTINADGTYVLDYKSGGSLNGTVVIETEEHPDGTETIWYSFYETDGKLWTGFQKTAGQPQNDLYSGQDGELHFFRATSISTSETTEATAAVTTAAVISTTAAVKATTTAAKPATTAAQTTAAAAVTTAMTAPTMPPDPVNAYGFTPVTQVPQTSVSVKQFDGTWFNVNNSAESLLFFDCDYLRGKFRMENADNSVTEGYIQLETKKNADGTETDYYNFYSNSEKLLFSVGTGTDIPFEQFSSTDGQHHYARHLDTNRQNQPEDFLGVWGSGKGTLTVSRSGSNFEVNITWPSSAAEYCNWTYPCIYQDGILTCNKAGTYIVEVYSEEGLMTQTVEYTNGTADFTLDASGNLVWIDYMELPTEGITFIR